MDLRMIMQRKLSRRVDLYPVGRRLRSIPLCPSLVNLICLPDVGRVIFIEPLVFADVLHLNHKTLQ